MFIVRDKLPTFEEIAGHIAQSVIPIAIGMRKDDLPNVIGTGFAVEWAEFFATCWHVARVDDELAKLSKEQLAKKGLKDNRLRVGLRKGDTYHWREVEAKTWMRGVSSVTDVCIYRIIGVAVPPLTLSPKDEWLWGSEVGIVGFPLSTVLQGNVLRPYVLKTIIAGGFELPVSSGARVSRLALGTTIASGFSGSPVFSAKDGQVVGMVSSTVLESEKDSRWAAGISLAVTPNLIRQGLESGIQVTSKRIKDSLRHHLK